MKHFAVIAPFALSSAAGAASGFFAAFLGRILLALLPAPFGLVLCVAFGALGALGLPAVELRLPRSGGDDDALLVDHAMGRQLSRMLRMIPFGIAFAGSYGATLTWFF
jgi:hypothetical protein